MKKTVILYHADCPDGFGAAWAAWKNFSNKADYIAVEHDEPPPKGLINKDIYLLDYTYFGAYLEKLLKNNNVTTIDHHISAKSAVEKAHQFYYALDHSGAVLSWMFFSPKKPVPRILRYIESEDLWKFDALPHAKEIVTTIHLTPYIFAQWDVMAKELEKASFRKIYADRGKIMLAHQNRIINELVDNADTGIFLGKKAGIVNSSSSLLKSDIGYVLIKKGFEVAIIWYRQGNKIKVGLRSNGNPDVTKLAKRFGGGGHKASSGFIIDASKKLPWRYTN